MSRMWPPDSPEGTCPCTQPGAKLVNPSIVHLDGFLADSITLDTVIRIEPNSNWLVGAPSMYGSNSSLSIYMKGSFFHPPLYMPGDKI